MIAFDVARREVGRQRRVVGHDLDAAIVGLAKGRTEPSRLVGETTMTFMRRTMKLRTRRSSSLGLLRLFSMLTATPACSAVSRIPQSTIRKNWSSCKSTAATWGVSARWHPDQTLAVASTQRIGRP